MSETVEQVESDRCGDTVLPSVTAEQFDFTGGFWEDVRLAFNDVEPDGVGPVDEATQWVRDYLVQQDAAWITACPEG